MRILIQTLASAGDTHPFVGVGEALPHRRYTAGRAARALRKLIGESGTAGACRAGKERVRAADPLEETCRLVEECRAEPIPTP